MLAPAPNKGAAAGVDDVALVPDVELVVLSPPSLNEPKPPSPVDGPDDDLLSVEGAAALPNPNEPELEDAGLDAPPKEKLGAAEVLDSAGFVPKLKLPVAGADAGVFDEGAALLPPKLKLPVVAPADFEPAKEKPPVAGAAAEPAGGLDPKPVPAAGVPNENGLFGGFDPALLFELFDAPPKEKPVPPNDMLTTRNKGMKVAEHQLCHGVVRCLNAKNQNDCRLPNPFFATSEFFGGKGDSIHSEPCHLHHDAAFLALTLWQDE